MSTNNKEKFELTSVQEEYLKIYHEYFVLNWSQVEIRRYHDCSGTKVSNALKWVIDNKVKIPADHLIKGAIDSISERLKDNKNLYKKEIAKKRYKDKLFIISLLREIREDEKSIFKLQEVYKGDDEENENKLNAGQVLALIKKSASTKE